jgi:hypothetical protein
MKGVEKIRSENDLFCAGCRNGRRSSYFCHSVQLRLLLLYSSKEYHAIKINQTWICTKRNTYCQRTNLYSSAFDWKNSIVAQNSCQLADVAMSYWCRIPQFVIQASHHTKSSLFSSNRTEIFIKNTGHSQSRISVGCSSVVILIYLQKDNNFPCNECVGK